MEFQSNLRAVDPGSRFCRIVFRSKQKFNSVVSVNEEKNVKCVDLEANKLISPFPRGAKVDR